MTKTISYCKALLFATVTGLIIFTMFSCKKAVTSLNAQFVGNYAGNVTVAGNTSVDTFQVTGGNSGNQVVVYDLGANGIVVIGTVSGNNITFADQPLNTNNFGSGSGVGTGSLSGSKLIVTLNDTLAGTPVAYSFSGTKL